MSLTGGIINTPTTTPDEQDQTVEYWKRMLGVFEVVEVILLATLTLVLACTVIYGTKTRRWRNVAGTSSVNNGVVYCNCTLAVLCYCFKCAITITIYQLPRMVDGSELCELMCDINVAAYGLCVLATYSFLLLRIRLIHVHPYVREKVANWTKWVMGLTFLLLIGGVLNLIVLITQSNTCEWVAYGCAVSYPPSEAYSAIQICNLVLVVCGQGFILLLSIYVAAGVQFKISNDIAESTDSNSAETLKLRCFGRLYRTVCGRISYSPVHLVVRRTFVSSVIIVVTDVITALIYEYGIPRSPYALGGTIYNMSFVIKSLCMIYTFSFGLDVLTFLLPKCSLKDSELATSTKTTPCTTNVNE